MLGTTLSVWGAPLSKRASVDLPNNPNRGKPLTYKVLSPPVSLPRFNLFYSATSVRSVDSHPKHVGITVGTQFSMGGSSDRDSLILSNKQTKTCPPPLVIIISFIIPPPLILHLYQFSYFPGGRVGISIFHPIDREGDGTVTIFVVESRNRKKNKAQTKKTTP